MSWWGRRCSALYWRAPTRQSGILKNPLQNKRVVVHSLQIRCVCFKQKFLLGPLNLQFVSCNPAGIHFLSASCCWRCWSATVGPSDEWPEAQPHWNVQLGKSSGGKGRSLRNNLKSDWTTPLSVITAPPPFKSSSNERNQILPCWVRQPDFKKLRKRFAPDGCLTYCCGDEGCWVSCDSKWVLSLQGIPLRTVLYVAERLCLRPPPLIRDGGSRSAWKNLDDREPPQT